MKNNKGTDNTKNKMKDQTENKKENMNDKNNISKKDSAKNAAEKCPIISMKGITE